MMRPIKRIPLSACLLMAALCLTAGLSACSKGSNPLTATTAHAAGVFLASASQHAEQSLKWRTARYGSGNAYGQCMTGKLPKTQCQVLYKAMVQYAKGKKAFQRLTVAELTARGTFETLRDAYQGAAFEL